jgi:hypothetical protein
MPKRINQDNRFKKNKLKDELASCSENKIRFCVHFKRIMPREIDRTSGGKRRGVQGYSGVLGRERAGESGESTTCT